MAKVNNSNKSNNSNNSNNKHMPLALAVNLDTLTTFGEGGKHLYFTAIEPDSEKKLLFKCFNYAEKLYKAIADNEKATVYFDIARSKDNNGGYQTQLVAYDVVPITK